MGLFSTMSISASGMSAETVNMNVISSNIANANTTSTADSDAYARKVTTFQSVVDSTGLGGVQVTSIVEDTSDMETEYDPDNANADENGYVTYSNVNILEEMADMMVATRAYEANADSIEAIKDMFNTALQIGQ